MSSKVIHSVIYPQNFAEDKLQILKINALFRSKTIDAVQKKPDASNISLLINTYLVHIILIAS